MVVLYNIAISLYQLLIQLAAFWNEKARNWIHGRKNLFTELQNTIRPNDEIIWIHCSSTGEFEQGKPVIESLKRNFPAYKILITFFSPSGYNSSKTYSEVDYVFYLPLDTKNNAEKFLRLINPKLCIFIKYEFWYHHLNTAAFKHVPILLLSAVFRKEQPFFKWYGRFFYRMLFLFRHIFVQDEESLSILKKQNIHHCSISGDTRFERVSEISKDSVEIPFIKQFLNSSTSIVAGSTWKEDEKLLKTYLETSPGVKLIIAPHEINKQRLNEAASLFPGAIFYSQIEKESDLKNFKVLIIDRIGLLSRLYKYGTITYVGGGFTIDGIHNLLEAAVYGKAVFIGPNYKKYREAKELIAAGGAFSVSDGVELKKIADELLINPDHLQQVNKISENYVLSNKGATSKIIQFIQEKRLLTN